MEYGAITQFIIKDIGEGKEFWVSGYANPSLKHNPKANVKPTKVRMVKNNADKPYRVGMYQYDKKFEYYIPYTSKNKPIPVNQFVFVYDTEEEAIQGYNAGVHEIERRYQEKIISVRKNLIDDNN